jgi:hypothetical protein
MNPMLPLDEMLGGPRADALMNQWTKETQELDGLPADVARRVVQARVVDGDPLLLTATGQMWTLGNQDLLEQVPALTLRVMAMVGPDDADFDPDETQFRYVSLDHDATATILKTAPVSLLRDYVLQAWNTPTGGHSTGGAA